MGDSVLISDAIPHSHSGRTFEVEEWRTIFAKPLGFSSVLSQLRTLTGEEFKTKFSQSILAS
jgi:hypothetical protein